MNILSIQALTAPAVALAAELFAKFHVFEAAQHFFSFACSSFFHL